MLIDLSVTLNRQTLVYPGDPAINIEPAGILGRDGWNDHVISVNTHVGTHMDVPLHMIAGGKTLDQVPIEQFVGRGRLIEASTMFGLERVQQADLQAGDIVLLRTGMSGATTSPLTSRGIQLCLKKSHVT